MGKLVKINNQQQITGAITAYFQEGFTIPPMGTIGLINMSCEMEERNIEITDENNTFRRAVIVGSFRDVVMRNGLYEIRSFIRELNRALNASLRNVAGAQQGFQFKPSITDKNLIKISFNRVPKTGYDYNLVGRTKWIVGMVANGNNGYDKNVANGWNSAVISNKFFTGGAGMFMCTLTTTENIIIGLVQNSSQAYYDNNFGISSYDFCTYIANDTAGATKVYWCRFTDGDGNITDIETANPATIGDSIGIMLTGGKLAFVAGTGLPYIDTPTMNVLHEIDWEYDRSYYGMMSMYTNADSVENVYFWNDPYHQITTTFEHYHEEAPEHNMILEDIDVPSLGGATNSVVTLQFTAPVLSLLGFQASPPPSPSTISGYFVGTRPYLDVVLPSNMKIILDNLAIESYDNVVKQHESILMTIPALTGDDGKFIYNAQFPLQIELKNKFPINISEIRLRLADFQRRLIKIKPDLTDITLFIS